MVIYIMGNWFSTSTDVYTLLDEEKERKLIDTSNENHDYNNKNYYYWGFINDYIEYGE